MGDNNSKIAATIKAILSQCLALSGSLWILFKKWLYGDGSQTKRTFFLKVGFVAVCAALVLATLFRGGGADDRAADPVSAGEKIFEERWGADVNEKYQDKGGMTPMHMAASAGDLDGLKWLKKQGATVQKDYSGNTPLHLAVDTKVPVEVMEWLIASGCGINERNSRGNTPLHAAVEKVSYIRYAWLLSRGADASVRNGNGLTAEELLVSIAETRGKDELSGNDAYKRGGVHALTPAGGTLMHSYAEKGNIPVMLYLQRRGVDINVRHPTWGDRTPLFSAVVGWGGQVDAVAWLLANGADANVEDLIGMTPFFHALKKGVYSRQMLECFKDSGTDLSYRNEEGKNGLFFCGSVESMEWLLENNFDLHAVDKNGQTLLHEYIEDHQEKQRSYLLAAGLDPAARDNAGNTPFLTAARRGIYMTAVEYGGTVTGNTVSLDDSVVNKEGKNVQALMEEYILEWINKKRERHPGIHDLYYHDKDGNTLLHMAAEDLEIMPMLTMVGSGIDINIPNNRGETPLFSAVSGYVSERKAYVLDFMLGMGANIGAKNKYGATPLHAAAWRSTDTRSMKWLIDNGVDVNAQDDLYGDTPLHKIARYADVYILSKIKLLLEHGADLQLRNKSGETPKMLAINEDNKAAILDFRNIP